jgi:hypothetical protein
MIRLPPDKTHVTEVGICDHLGRSKHPAVHRLHLADPPKHDKLSLDGDQGVFSFGKTAKHALDAVTQLSVSDFTFKVGIAAADTKVPSKQKAILCFKIILRHLAKEIKAHLSIDAVNLTNSSLKDLNKRAAFACMNIFYKWIRISKDTRLDISILGAIVRFHSTRKGLNMHTTSAHAAAKHPRQGQQQWHMVQVVHCKRGCDQNSDATRSGHFFQCLWPESPATTPSGVIADEFIILW